MANLLVATVPLTGHVQPMCLLVRELVARGHTVRWLAGRKFAKSVTETGAELAPLPAAVDWDDADLEAAFPALRRVRGLARVRAQLRAMFIAPMGAQLAALEALARDAAPAAILADSAHLGAALFAERAGVRWIGLGVSALVVPSADTAPFGSALRPRSRVVNRLLNRLVFRWLFAGVNRSYRRARVAAGLPAGRGTYFDVLAPDLFLQPTIPAFEYPRADLPAQVRFIGPLVPRAGAAELPAWWPDVLAAHARGTPVVLVTQGTLATAPSALLAPALAALADEPVLVVATTGRADAALGAVPANARCAPFVPYAAVMPLLAAMITNGGYGGVQLALAHGVPLVVAGGSEEKPEIAARVAWSGAGLDLRTGTPRPAAVRAALRRVLVEPAFAARAKVLAAAMAETDAPATGAALIEGLIGEAERGRLSRHA